VRLTRIAIFAVGYVVGTRAGRERYEQILAAARSASQRLESHFDSGDQPAAKATSTNEASDSGSVQR